MSSAHWVPVRESGRHDHEDREARTRGLLARLEHETDPHIRRQIRNEVVVGNLDLARTLAAAYRGRGIDFEDLYQVAGLGLVKATQRFRLRVGGSFRAFARPTIAGEIKRCFRDQAWVVRPPRGLQELHAEIRDAEAGRGSIPATYGAPAGTGAPTPSTGTADLAAHLGRSEADVVHARDLGSCFTPDSLDARRPAGRPAGETVADEGPNPYEHVESLLDLRAALAHLGEEDRRLLQMRFVEGLSQQRIGQRLGVSQMQVSRRLRRVLSRLRQEMSATG